MLAERVGVSVPTIGKLEDGNPATSLATMLRVLGALGLAADIDLLAAQDTLGRSLQDSELKRAMPTQHARAISAMPTPRARKKA
jgi:transcriptional regulator with XRE-family HTH domain